jgi:L-lactate dehydrogenase complex protein LldG
MKEARNGILTDIRRALRRGRLDGAAEAELRARVGEHRRNVIPARAAALDDPARIELFVTMAQEAQATIARVGAVDAIPGEIADYLARENRPAECFMAPDPNLDAIPWESRPLLRIRRGGTPAADATTVTPAFAAVAETGTLLMISGPDTPTTLNFLPDTHVVILRADQIVASYEDAWDRLRAVRTLPQDLPRAVNFITGPSRTGDIEQQIVRGMHGPRRLHIILVETRSAVGDGEPSG